MADIFTVMSTIAEGLTGLAALVITTSDDDQSGE